MAGKTDRNIRMSIFLNDKTGGKTLRELRTEAKKLRNEIAGMKYGTEEYIAKSKKLKEVNAGIQQINKSLMVQQGFWNKASGFANKYFTLITSFVGIAAGFVFSVKNMIDRSGELSDAIADVMKTTGLAKEDVMDLMGEFDDFNTRTPRKELLELARIAGKLGINSKSDVLQFVRAADQINVALGEDLGGNAEEAIRQIGKLTTSYKLAEKQGLSLEDGLLKTGSAINSLGAASTANEGYIVEFTKRLGGIAPVANIGIEDILGLGAALDSLGQTSEVSATAIQKILPDMFLNTADYAHYAKMNVDEFSALLKADANEALLKFLEGLNGNNEGLATMAIKLDDLGLDGARAVGVLSVLANNVELVRDQQKLSNDEFEKGTSLTEEFNTKNENLAASLAKIGRRIYGAFISSNFLNVLTNIVKKIDEWTTKKLDKKLEEERVQVNLLVTKLTNLNTSEEDRKKIYEELKTISPDIVDGIDAENISVIKLTGNLKKYNEQLVKKLALYDSEKLLEKERQNVADATAKKLQKEDELILDLMKLEGEASKGLTKKYDKNLSEELTNIRLSADSVLNKYTKAQALITEFNDKMLEQKTNHVILTNSLTNSQAYLIEAMDEETAATLKMDKALASYEEKYKRLFSEKKEPVVTPDPVNPDEDPNPDENLEKTLEELKKEKEEREKAAKERKAKEARLNAEILEIREQLYQGTLDLEAKELRQINVKYDALVKEAGKNKEQILQIEELRAAELEAKEKEHLEARKEREEKLQQDLIDLKTKYGIYSQQELYEMELAELQKSLDDKLISEEEYLIALAKLKEKFKEGEDEQLTDAEKERKRQKEKAEEEAWKAAENMMVNYSNSILDKEKKFIDEKYDFEIDNLKRSLELKIISQDEYDAAVSKIERERLNEIAEKEREFALWEIAIQTAVAAVKALTKDPSGIASLWVLAQGGIQAAVVAAKPIPQYEHGVDSHPGGLAIVGEAGPELVNLPMGAQVIPNYHLNPQLLESLPKYRDGVYSEKTIREVNNNFNVDPEMKSLMKEMLLYMKNPKPAVAYYGQDEVVKIRDEIGKQESTEGKAIQ